MTKQRGISIISSRRYHNRASGLTEGLQSNKTKWSQALHSPETTQEQA
jgi:hypothetical protein